MPYLTGYFRVFSVGWLGRVCSAHSVGLGVFASVFLHVERLGTQYLVFLACIKHRTLLRASHPAAGAFGRALPSGGDAVACCPHGFSGAVWLLDPFLGATVSKSKRLKQTLFWDGVSASSYPFE